MNRMAIVIVSSGALGCQIAHSKPETGSETHFLAGCTEARDCRAPYACLCGVCSLPCDADDRCTAHADRARCVAPSSASELSCERSALMCDVECTRDVDCVGLAQSGVCSQGRCREVTATQPPLTAPEAGISDAATARDAQTQAGDAGAATTEAGPVLAALLCDGSDAVRAGVAVRGGGPLEPTFDLTNPYGHSFAFIDGKCRYFAGSNYMQGIAQGTLTESEAQQLSTELGWSMLPSWRAHVDDACPDGAFTMLMRDGATASCSCGCDEDAPTGLADAVTAALRWVQELQTRGTRLSGPVRAAAFTVQRFIPTATWPLSRGMASIPGLINAQGSATTSALFDAAADFNALRALRADNLGQSMTRGISFVRVADTTGGAYDLYVVDTMPDLAASAIADFEQRAAQP